MCHSKLHKILSLLKSPILKTKSLDQIYSQTITSGLIYVSPTWNCIIRAYSKSYAPMKAILVYNYFLKGSPISIHADNCTYPALLKSCTRIYSLAKGSEVHCHAVKIGVDSDVYVQNALVHFYGHVGLVSYARKLFGKMPERDIITWNTLLGVYNVKGSSQGEVFVLFKDLMGAGVRPDEISFVIMFSACGYVGAVEFGRMVHGCVMKMGIGCHLKMENAMLDMYVKCRELDSALRIFNGMSCKKDVVSYTILINGYVDSGFLDLARDLFDRNVDKDIVLWNSMIHGYIEAKRPGEVMELFERMKSMGPMPDENTLVDVLLACAELSDLLSGRFIHRFILRNGVKQDVFVETALIYMYLKCGSLEEAIVTFYKMDYKDVYTWTTIIEGLATYGLGNRAVSLFLEMEKQGIEPNEASFVSVLTACRHSGLIDEGCRLFNRMVHVYSITPQIIHLGCLVDLLSRAGNLEHAEEYIESLQPEHRLVGYKTLLNACMTYSKLDLGWKVATELKKLGSNDYGVHVLLSNFYALAGQWTEVANSRRILKEFDASKEPGVSSSKPDQVQDSEIKN